jgi:hypothetical protein
LKMPLAYADQFYVLREHIGFVRHRLTQAREMQPDDADNPDEGPDGGPREHPGNTPESRADHDPGRGTTKEGPESATPAANEALDAGATSGNTGSKAF